MIEYLYFLQFVYENIYFILPLTLIIIKYYSYSYFLLYFYYLFIHNSSNLILIYFI